ncbi:hypothetical protein M427DRAFT_172246 [Gonapodya prolifera JEL478]|uniref:UBA domain-containing protein n=1 Tax=Gonapodya prolifera (strain JEL478) TaxID=1344416 RepID=A0A139B0C9_GONPJ|nr:hypothetical protein M427DRAFT_172246 [Gonapodya prolifera JEL478]|eukprot:KXS22429.1 hypothetical protein M427DRAFT_172246 [Gonapodya prolifera JEL478]
MTKKYHSWLSMNFLPKPGSKQPGKWKWIMIRKGRKQMLARLLVSRVLGSDEFARLNTVVFSIPAPAVPPLRPAAGSSTSSPPQSTVPFSGSGHRLGTSPVASPSPSINPPTGTVASTPQLSARPNPAPPPRTAFSEESISTLMALGASREEALQALQAAGGNVDIAGALLFQ